MTGGYYTITRVIVLAIQEIFSAARHRDLRSPSGSPSCARQIDPLENQTEIAGVNLEACGVPRREPKRAALETPVEQAVPAAREEQHLHPVAASIPEGEEMARQWILFENLARQRGETVEASA
jgi:hypothetical protein